MDQLWVYHDFDMKGMHSAYKQCGSFRRAQSGHDSVRCQRAMMMKRMTREPSKGNKLRENGYNSLGLGELQGLHCVQELLV